MNDARTVSNTATLSTTRSSATINTMNELGDAKGCGVRAKTGDCEGCRIEDRRIRLDTNLPGAKRGKIGHLHRESDGRADGRCCRKLRIDIEKVARRDS